MVPPATSDSPPPTHRGTALVALVALVHVLAVFALILFAYLILSRTADNETWYYPEEPQGDPDGAAIASLAATLFVATPVIVLTYAVALTVSHLMRRN